MSSVSASLNASSELHESRRWGSVFDRLYDPVTYTGVYAERFRSGPGINHDAEAKLHHHVTSFTGSTNEGSDERVKDIKFVTRPNLNRDRGSPSSPMARATAKTRLRYQAAEEALEAVMRQGELQTLEGPMAPSVYVMRASDGGGLDTQRSGASAAPELPLDTNLMLSLLFQYYCRFGRTSGSAGEGDDGEESMDSFNFSKMTRDCHETAGLLDRTLNPTEVDLIFVKCKTKHQRRLKYDQWLAALSAMATIKFQGVADAATAFSLFLSTYVLTLPAAVGIARAIRANLIQAEPIAPSPRLANAASEGSVGSAARAGPFSVAAVAAGLAPSAMRGRRLAPEVGAGPAPTLLAAPSPRPDLFAGTGSPRAATSPRIAGVPDAVSALPGFDEAMRAAAAAFAQAQQAASSGGSGDDGAGARAVAAAAAAAAAVGASSPSHAEAAAAPAPAGASLSPSQPPPPPQGHSASPGAGSSSGAGAGGGLTAAQASLASVHGMVPPADAYELLQRLAMDIYAQQRSAHAQAQAQPPEMAAAFAAAAAAGGMFTPGPGAAAAASGASRGSPRGPSSPRTGGETGRPWSPSLAGPGGAALLGLSSQPSFRAVTAAERQRSPRTRSPSLTSSRAAHGGGAGLGEPGFVPHRAGEANAPGSIFARLSDPADFTGVYRRGYQAGGINHHADGRPAHMTDANSNSVVHNIRDTLRPNLIYEGTAGPFRP